MTNPLQAGVDHAELRRLAEAATKIAPGLWGSDIEKGDGEYGIGDETHTGYMVPYMETERGKRLFDAHNTDVALIEEDCSFDENGADYSAWDENSAAIFNYLAAVQPSNVLALLNEIDALKDEVEKAQTLDKGFYDWLIDRDFFDRHDTDIEWSDIVTALTEHEIEIAAPVLPDRGWRPDRGAVARIIWERLMKMGGPWYPSAKPSDSPAMRDTFAAADAILALPDAPAEGAE